MTRRGNRLICVVATAVATVSMLAPSATVAHARAASKPAAAHALPRSAPEAQGMSSEAIESFVRAADEKFDSLHSVIVVRHGHVIAEGYWNPYSAESRHMLFSLTKSFTSTAVGMAVTEGKLHVEDLVLPMFPDDAPAEPSDNLKALRVRDLLTMASGQHMEAQVGPNEPWTKTFLAQPVVHKPGTFFLYNTPGSFMLSAIVQKVTGMTELEYLRPRLFEPLGIEDPVWQANPQGISIGGYGLSVHTEDIAKFGLLYLHKGEWEGKQLLPASWVEMATSRWQSNGSNPSSDWDQGYGFQFWRCRNGAYRGDGAFGQFCVIFPKQDTVVAITSGVSDLQGVLNLVWDILLPAMKPDALPASEANDKRLQATLAGLSVHKPTGDAKSAVAVGKTYAFPANDQKLESLALEQGADGGMTIVAVVNGSTQRIACGRGAWIKGRSSFDSGQDQPMAATGAWTAPDTYIAKMCLYETPFELTTTLHFVGDRLECDTEYNVAFGPKKRPQLVGTVK